MSAPPPIVFRSLSFERAPAPAPPAGRARRILGAAAMVLRGRRG